MRSSFPCYGSQNITVSLHTNTLSAKGKEKSICHEIAHALLPVGMYDDSGGHGPEHERLIRKLMGMLYGDFGSIPYRRKS
jgi:hypothetical protein